mmetsp:Transcript_21467/g.59063  ORF Transcript_21467/g.59063 Transcript_21467/m.59063 type:complete len:374 (-) Transcript_21467:449-1570(-)
MGMGPAAVAAAAMDSLRLELERKRKEREEAGGGGGGSTKKWVRRGEIEAARAAAYRAAEAAEAEERAKKLVVPCLRSFPSAPLREGEREGQRGSEGKGPVVPAVTSASASVPVDISTIEVQRLLRKLGQPITLFGEGEEERLARYKAVLDALPAEDENIELKRGQMFNETQLFDERGRAKQQLDHAEASGGEEAKAEGAEEDEYGGEEMEAAFTPTTPEQIVSRHFKRLVKMWEEEIASKDEATAGTAAAKREAATFQQCRRHMKPFFRQLKSRTMPLDILNTMTNITQHMSNRDYVKAHDAYILCAIGNAPWPMGITGTGVHERQGRQHIREAKVAHVMNDETQRKYLQSVKRLMTYAQRALPPSGPSMMVS